MLTLVSAGYCWVDRLLVPVGLGASGVVCLSRLILFFKCGVLGGSPPRRSFESSTPLALTPSILPSVAPCLQGAAPLNMNPPKPQVASDRGVPRKVVYVPTCVTRIMGPAKGDYETGGCWCWVWCRHCCAWCSCVGGTGRRCGRAGEALSFGHVWWV